MSKPVFVYSTLTNDNAYGPYSAGGGDLPNKPKKVVILGGANRADRDNRLWTPLGVCTRITQEQLALCEEDPIFTLHKKNGFIVVSEKEENADDVATADMEGRSQDAPIVPGDIDTENAVKPDDKQMSVVSNVGPAKAARAPRAKGTGRKPGSRKPAGE